MGIKYTHIPLDMIIGLKALGSVPWLKGTDLRLDNTTAMDYGNVLYHWLEWPWFTLSLHGVMSSPIGWSSLGAHSH